MEDSKEVTSNLHSIRDYVRWAMSRFSQHQVYFGHGTDNAWDEAVSLIFSILHLPIDGDQRLLDANLTLGEKRQIFQLVETRCYDKVPVPYITGKAMFAGLEFIVDERVLIPRSPIAELILDGLGPWFHRQPERLLDLCTGSGCIGIAATIHLGCEQATLVDLSSDANAVAKQNIEKYQLDERIEVIQSDLFESLSTEDKFDVILTNPPYVDAKDLATMPNEYRHEPIMGLEAGNDGLELAHRILAESSEYLADDGLLVMEVGNSWVALEESYPNVPFTWIEFENGGHGVCVFSAAELRQYFHA